jgi:hypothetical protein
MLIDIYSTLRVWDTRLAMNFMSDRTHLLNIAGYSTEWPVYMITGNLSVKIRQRPSSHSFIVVTPLPIPIKNGIIPLMQRDEQRQTT